MQSITAQHMGPRELYSVRFLCNTVTSGVGFISCVFEYDCGLLCVVCFSLMTVGVLCIALGTKSFSNKHLLYRIMNTIFLGGPGPARPSSSYTRMARDAHKGPYWFYMGPYGPLDHPSE